MDVIACQRAGLPAVAPMGTALTEEQMERLWRVSHEPVLCFDGDAAGLRAAYRAIERSLPLLKAGRSFRFSLLSGGQDPDDILRDKGAPALRQALADTHGFAEVLFRREQDVEPLDTPERKAGFKARLRTAASAIQDKDLAEQYRRDLFDRFDALFPRAPQRFGPPPKLGQTVEGAQAMQSLFRAVSPVAAALAYAAIDDIERLDDHLEEVSVQGFGDAALEGLAQELVRLRLSGQPSDAAVVRHRLRDSGFEPLLKEIEKAASKSGASFLSSDLTVAESRAHWLKVFGLMTHLAALSRAIETAKQDMGQGTGIDALVRLKAERDAITRSFAAPDFWTTLI